MRSLAVPTPDSARRGLNGPVATDQRDTILLPTPTAIPNLRIAVYGSPDIAPPASWWRALRAVGPITLCSHEPLSAQTEGSGVEAGCLVTSPEEPEQVLRALATLGGAQAWLLVRRDAVLPAGLPQRVARWMAAAGGRAVSPCTPEFGQPPRVDQALVGNLAAQAERAGDTAAARDRWMWNRGRRASLEVRGASALLSLWPAALLARLDAEAGSMQHAPALLMQDSWVEAGSAQTVATTSGEHIGLDQRPVLLHVLHGWGGGAERFVSDFASHDTAFQHLILRAETDPTRQLAGVALTLHRPGEESALQRWPLAPAIASCVLQHAMHAEILRRICADYGVGGLLVSSAIGHALDVLDTGLPTAIVCHDYFPVWPGLSADFGDTRADFGAGALAAALTQDPHGFPFGTRDPEHWQSLRDRWVRRIVERNMPLFAPSTTVRANLTRIEPSLAAASWVMAPHGLAPWPKPAPDWTAQRAPVRLLVPGRIHAGKGERLLRALAQRLPDGIELILLGAGAAGMQFFGCRGFHVVMNYERDALPQWIAELRPAAALLLSTVAETYSYTLSEMRSLGVPVLATRRGSFAERIRDGVDGALIDVDPEALLRWMQGLLDGTASLPPGTTPDTPLDTPSLDDMCRRYDDALALEPPALPPIESMSPTELALSEAEFTRDALHEELASTRNRLTASVDESDRRGTWAREQSALAEERLDWARNLEDELGGTKTALQSANDHVDELGVEIRRLQERENELESIIQDVTRHRDEILASSSWRLTRPLRGARRLVDRVHATLRYRLARLASLQRRGTQSLRTRGLNATLRRAQEELRRGTKSPGPAAVHVDVSRDLSGIAFAHHDAPRASVVIPAYNHLDHTITCLRSLAEHAPALAMEVIVVDDCGQDETAELLPAVPGLVFHRNAENLGFIGACNAGASLARGEFVVFLNNDTAVRAGWLDALVETFDRHRDVGLVGAKLIYPDGRLQEAGGIVFADGSGWNYGRFDDPGAPAYNYVREVDYCSGAAICLPRALFDELGGFDPLYAPAYYEDTDLAMKVHAKGLRVLYQPRSEVIHFEGISSGTDTSSGIKRYQVVNQEKFLDRWRETLAGHAKPGTDIRIAREHRCRRRVLVIDATTPQPDQDSGSVRLVNLLRILQQDGAAVTFFADNRAWDGAYSEALQQLGMEVLWHPHLDDPLAWLREHGRSLDMVIVSRHYVLNLYMDVLRRYAPAAKVVFDTVDLHYLREQREAELAGREDMRRTAAETRRRELDLIRRADITLVVSPVEQELLAREAPGARVDVLSNVHEVVGCRRPFDERRDIMFVGGFQHPPNVDAVEWFCGAIWPIVHASEPELRFHIIGSKMPDALRRLADQEGVVVHGFVPDIEPYLDGSRLAVAPLRYGAGVKGKVNMSMAYGQPVIATPIAVEGMFLQAGEEALVAESAEDFADALLRAYRDPELWQQLSAAGLANVERHFSFDAARRAVRHLWSDARA